MGVLLVVLSVIFGLRNTIKISVEADIIQIGPVENVLNATGEVIPASEQVRSIRQPVELISTVRVLCIHNKSQPIPTDSAARLFNPFYSPKSTGQGIDLTLSREILPNHRLPFSLQTNDDGWSKFR